MLPINTTSWHYQQTGKTARITPVLLLACGNDQSLDWRIYFVAQPLLKLINHQVGDIKARECTLSS